MFPVILLLKDERIALKLRSLSQSGERLFHDVSDNFNRLSKNMQENGERIALIFTDVPTGSGSCSCALLEICEFLNKLEISQHRLTLPNTKYNYTVSLFESNVLVAYE